MKKQYIELNFHQPLLRNIRQILIISQYQRFVQASNILRQSLKLVIKKLNKSSKSITELTNFIRETNLLSR